MFVPALLMNVSGQVTDQIGEQLGITRQTVSSILPLGFLGLSMLMALMSMGEKGIYFSPAEINFLFSGPFTRRQLLVYRIATNALGVLIGALFCSVPIAAYGSSWFPAFIGLVMTLQFISLLSMSTALTSQIISQNAYSIGRRIVMVVICTLMIAGLAEVFEPNGELHPLEIAIQFRHSTAGTIVTAPFAVFTDLIAASEVNLKFAGGLAVALGINALLLLITIRLDANYLETSVRVSEKLYQRLLQMQSGGSFFRTGRKGRAYKRILPRLPRWSGVGPVAQAQLTTSIRSSGRMLITVAFIAVIATCTIAFSRPALFTHGVKTAATIIGVMMYATLIASLSLPLGFRGDVDHIDWLKSLPITSRTVAAGEVLGPTLFMSLVNIAVFLPASLVVTPPWIMLVAAVCVPPAMLLLFAVDNLTFTLHPVRQKPTNPGDMQFVGLKMVHTLLQFLLFGLTTIPVIVVGAVAWFVGGAWCSIPAMWVTAGGIGIVMIQMIARGFERFDPATDTPA